MENVQAERMPIIIKIPKAGKIAPFTSPRAVILPGSEIAPAPMIFFARLKVDFGIDDDAASTETSVAGTSSGESPGTEAVPEALIFVNGARRGIDRAGKATSEVNEIVVKATLA